MIKEKIMADKKKGLVSERRRYIRISPPKPLKVKYRFVEGHGRSEISNGDILSSSVSGGGLFLEFPHLEAEMVEKLLSGAKKLSLEIELPNATRPIKALGQVVWMEGRKGGDRNYYGAGVSFTRIDEDERDEIINYIIDLYLQEKNLKETK